MKKAILDLEFNGLPNYIFKTEICQVLLRNLENGKTVIRNFKTNTPMTAGALVCCGGNDWSTKGEVLFSKEEFEKLLAEVGFTPEDNIVFFGFGTKTDREILQSYSIHLRDYYNWINTPKYQIVDLQELCRLQEELEKDMIGSASLEAVHYLIYKEIKTPVHGTEEELDLIHDIYNYLLICRQDKWLSYRESLKYVPWGQYAGMDIYEYVFYYRRQADGYRYNNNDIYARSLNMVIVEQEDDDYECVYE